MTIQQQMLELLSDGQPHNKAELHTFCGPSSRSVVMVHICRLRKQLRPKGQDILLTVQGGRYFYQLVRLLAPAELE